VQVVAASAVLGITAPVKGLKEKANVAQATIVPVAVACVAAALTVQVIDHGKHETIPS
jgi:VIT1/CCC1 family predicted Fe2+/Mn2+ transporter